MFVVMFKEMFLKFLKVASAVVYTLFLIITCAAVWNAAIGETPATFYVVCSVIYFLVTCYFIYDYCKKNL